MDIKNLVPVEWSNQRVLTTAQLAEFYECEASNIKKNFNSNKARFIEGKHFFKAEGADLQNLQVTFGDLQISPMTRKLYLWTERGAARHAKMLSTDKAWEVYEELEDNYFNPNVTHIAAPAAKPAAKEPDLARVYLLRLSDGTIFIVKIGHSKNIRARVAKIKRETGLHVVNMYFTPYMSRKDARLVEWAAQEQLSSRRVKGEFFSVDFDEARNVVDYFVEITLATLPNQPANLIADN